MISLKILKTNETVDITDFLETISWSGDYLQAARQIEFAIVYSTLDKNLNSIELKLGNLVALYENNNELFRGYIFFKDKSSSGNRINYTAYDLCIYTLKNEGSYNFRNTTPEGATKRICSDFNIPQGEIAKTGINLNKKFIGVNLYEIILSAYTVAYENTTKKYMLLAEKGKLNIIEKGKETLKVEFQNGFNIIDTHTTESLDNMVNRVRIVDKDGNFIRDLTNNDNFKAYGSMQKVITKTDGKDENKRANSLLKGIENKIKLKGIGNTGCITGKAVKVYDNYTNLTGLFYIDSDKHTWNEGIYTVELTLNLNNIMNETERGSD